MAIKQQEKNFLISIGVFAVAVALSIFLLPMIAGSKKPEEMPPPPNKETVRIQVSKSLPPKAPKSETDKKPQPQKEEEKPSDKEVPAEQANEAILVLSKPKKVPTDYFEDGSGTAEVPRVVERYLEAVKNGSRFMGRLESIALRDNKVREEQRNSAKSSQPLQLELGDTTKVISYNMKINTPFLAARFDTAAIDDFKGDVLVEWLDSEKNERIELFFTPLNRDGEMGQFRLNVPESLIPPASEVYVYSVTDDMPLIASGAYKP